MAANLVRFVYTATATPEQIAAFDSNTIYFIGNTHQIYKGTNLFDGGAGATATALQTLATNIGTLPISGYSDLIDYIDKSIAAGDETVTGLVTTLENSLADVAKSGAAADVSVADAGSLIDATTVEDALQELAQGVANVNLSAAVTLEKLSGGNVATSTNTAEYNFYQGLIGTETAEQKAAKKVGTIEIAKDLVATSGTLVDQDGNGNAGTFIEMTIANSDPFYINVADLIEYNAVQSTTEITLTDTNHTISATVGKIAATKIIYSEANGNTPEVTVKAKIDALEEAIGDGIDALDGTAGIASESNGIVTLKAGITEVDGVIDNDANADITLAKVATTGNAVDVAYGASSNVKAALDTIGAIPAGATATTVVGYVDEKVTGVVSGLDADVDAALTASDTDPEAVAVVTGVTEVDGVITSVDSIAADAAGAATRAKAAVIGQSGDAATANTVYGAKAYADSVVADLDATVTATGTAQHAGTFVVTSVTQTDGELTSVVSTEVEAAGAAAAAETAAKAYTDTLLTWGSLS